MKTIRAIVISVFVIAIGLLIIDNYDMSRYSAFVVGIFMANINRLLHLLNGDDE